MSTAFELDTVSPPSHVVSAFGLESAAVAPLGSTTFRYGDVVLSAAGDPARAGWSARVRETLAPAGFRVARPVRSSDGRYVISGWRADMHVEGSAQPRYDELVAASIRLQPALAGLARPRFLVGPVAVPLIESDVYLVADRAAWEPDPSRYLAGAANWPGGSELVEHQDQVLAMFRALTPLREPVNLPNQVVHGDLLATVVFHGSADPGVTDLVPYWRPAVWGTALVVVDALVWGDADPALPGRWAHLPSFPQLMLRALLFRLAVHLLHPLATEATGKRLGRAVDIVRAFL
ncbi:TIGR02569 family protein [Segniliparus rugosus]|uniref:TIGR02569 family protein n=1 Tax=Segniliparus rugosus (strain ATCC BAA-974 / DSM 45345 / CCUG 50838 / CIP 108380 / JCM 13579 / CDC 945) TaxID=679197 RepID=E5XUL6_SEGRC|nr:TIGR02569 family protein [Segniliparus rugosus]EFV11995.1 TIGR02569 family protein [Segniliparus rugosus ATCC BAA-974]